VSAKLEEIRDRMQNFHANDMDSPADQLNPLLDILVDLVEEVQRIEAANIAPAQSIKGP